MWSFVIPHFNLLLTDFELTDIQKNEAISNAIGVGECLFKRYYEGLFDRNTVRIVGSHGKGTTIRPPTDIDILFVLPSSEFHRINGVRGNRQSYLLQEIKSTLLQRFSRTDLRGDGQVVIAPFASYSVEVAPAFQISDGKYLICDTANGGNWKPTDPVSEINAINGLDLRYQKKATHLIKFLKAWKRNCNVEIKSLILEIAACHFIAQWPYRSMTIFWYDWMIRDFFLFLLQYKDGTAKVPGVEEILYLGDSWYTKCQTAYAKALKACQHEYYDQSMQAEEEWATIFGDRFPKPNLENLFNLLKSLRPAYG